MPRPNHILDVEPVSSDEELDQEPKIKSFAHLRAILSSKIKSETEFSKCEEELRDVLVFIKNCFKKKYGEEVVNHCFFNKI